jgi:hypothetical protein
MLVRAGRSWGRVIVERDLVEFQGRERRHFWMRKVFTVYDGGKRAHLTCNEAVKAQRRIGCCC